MQGAASDAFDGELSDVFELQERIARSITDALSVILVGDQQTRLVPVATRDPEAYALYLQASAIFARRDGARFAEAITELEEAVRRDPQFARAHAQLRRDGREVDHEPRRAAFVRDLDATAARGRVARRRTRGRGGERLPRIRGRQRAPPS